MLSPALPLQRHPGKAGLQGHEGQQETRIQNPGSARAAPTLPRPHQNGPAPSDLGVQGAPGKHPAGRAKRLSLFRLRWRGSRPSVPSSLTRHPSRRPPLGVGEAAFPLNQEADPASSGQDRNLERPKLCSQRTGGSSECSWDVPGVIGTRLSVPSGADRSWPEQEACLETVASPSARPPPSTTRTGWRMPVRGTDTQTVTPRQLLWTGTAQRGW